MPSDGLAWTHLQWQSCLEECFSAPHLPGDNTLALTASCFDEQRADIPLWQVDSKLHKKEREKTFPRFISMEILFTVVGFAMYTILTLHGVMKSSALCPIRGHHWKIIARPMFKNWRSFSSATQAVVWFRWCFTGFPVGGYSCPSNAACCTNRQSYQGLGRGG